MPEQIDQQPNWWLRRQIICEALYLLVLLVISVALVFAIHFGWFEANGWIIQPASRVYLYAALGGLLGGWAFDMKWLYRGVAHMRICDPRITSDIVQRIETCLDDTHCTSDLREVILKRIKEHDDCWRPGRLYWRLFTPPISALVAFAVYLAGVSGAIFVKIENSSGAFAFSFCFILGYFSDAVVSKMANWVESLLGN